MGGYLGAALVESETPGHGGWQEKPSKGWLQPIKGKLGSKEEPEVRQDQLKWMKQTKRYRVS